MIRSSLLLALVMALAVGLVSCNFFTNPVLTSISVTPNSPTVVVGGTQQLTATGVNDDGSSSNVTVTWMSSDVTVATIDANSGLAAAVKAGTTTITASSTGSPPVSGTTTMTVTSSAITAITVSDSSNGTISAVGGTDQLHATATFADGSTKDITSSATWTSSNPAIATVTSPGGLATGVAAGTAQVTAASGNITSSPFTVNVL